MSDLVQFTQAERDRIKRDILQWRTESELTGGGSFEFDEYLDELQSCSDEELRDWWWSSVGEWLLSRSDVYDEFLSQVETENEEVVELHDDFIEFVAGQFDRVVAGEELSYGYLPGAIIEGELS